MADHPGTCRERCFYCGMDRYKTLALTTLYIFNFFVKLVCIIISTYQYFLITIKFNILEWRGNYKSHEIRVWKNEGKKLSTNLYTTDFMLEQSFEIKVFFLSKKISFTFVEQIWQHLQVLQNKSLTVGDRASGRDRGSCFIVREICFHGSQPEKCGSSSVWRQCWY